ncbi:hypothetical protein [Lentzea aerocolonigenes]|uniref:hypothetical protein n=1 Tax=Lentzea aerocolonigenes TaxID=68170 RepID=UPI001E388179|nr:hypothetical protein [Lentzea aerocolonigenes]
MHGDDEAGAGGLDGVAPVVVLELRGLRAECADAEVEQVDVQTVELVRDEAGARGGPGSCRSDAR